MGQVIAAYRRHPFHGTPLPQEAVGQWVGISQPQLSRLENGPPIKNLDKLVLWARTLRIPAYLLWFSFPEVPNASGTESRTDVFETAGRTVRVPPLGPDSVARSEDIDLLVSMLAETATRAERSSVVAVSGPGGFGKTTLALQACHDERVDRLFADILWIETGEHCTPGRIVHLISDLCLHLTGVRSEFEDADQAGFHLAKVLTGRRVMLAIDNVWSADDLSPFLLGGAGTVRLVTTRNARTCPVRTRHLRLGPMSSGQITGLLRGTAPSLRRRDTTELASRCQGWPLLASVVGANVEQDITSGASPQQAVAVAIEALDTVGPPAFDLSDSDHRTVTLGHAITASAGSLEKHVVIPGTAGLKECYFSLAIFPPTTPIPLSVLSIWWRQSYGWPAHAVRQFCRVLADRCLIDAYQADRDTIVLHDVFRAHLRQLIGDDWRDLHRSLVDAYRQASGGAWADLGVEHTYMWRHLAHHLVEAGLTSELLHILGSARYVVTKAVELGSDSLAVDVATLDRLRSERPPMWDTAHALVHSGYLLHGLTTREDIAATLLASSARVNAAKQVVNDLDALAGERGFRSTWTALEPSGGEGHIGAVISLAVHDDLLVSAGEDGDVRLWSLKAGRCLRHHWGHTGWIYATALSPDGTTIASAGEDAVIRLWNAQTGEPMGALVGHSRRIRALAYATNSLLVSGGEDGLVCLWEVDNGDLVRTMRTRDLPVWAVATGFDHDFLVAAAGQGASVRLFDLGNGSIVDEKVAHDDWIRTLASAGRTVVSGSGDSSVRVWEVDGRRLRVDRAIDTPSRVRTVAVSRSNDETVVAAGEDATLRRISRDGTVVEQPVPEAIDWIRTVALLPDDSVVAGCEDGGLRLWDGKSLTTLSHGQNTTWSTAFTGGHALLGRSDGSLQEWDTTSSRLLRTHQAGDGRIWSLAASSRVVAAACADGSVRVSLLDDGRTLRLNENEQRTWAVALDRANNRIAASARDGTVRVWDLPSGQLLWERLAHQGRIRSMSFDHDSELLVTGGGEGVARVWGVADGKEIGEYGPGGVWVRSVAVDASASLLALGCGTGDIYVYDRADERLVARLSGHSGRVLMVGFTRVDNNVVSAAADGTVRLWSLAQGEQLAAVRLDASLQCATFSPALGVALATSFAGTVALRVPMAAIQE